MTVHRDSPGGARGRQVTTGPPQTSGRRQAASTGHRVETGERPGEPRPDATSRAGGNPELAERYSSTEAAELLGVTARRIRQLVLQGTLEGGRDDAGLFWVSGPSARAERQRREDAVTGRLADGARRPPSWMESVTAGISRAAQEAAGPQLAFVADMVERNGELQRRVGELEATVAGLRSELASLRRQTRSRAG